MSANSCFDFDRNYFELPFTNELKPVSKKDQETVHTIVYVKKCTKGYMIFSDEHKIFVFYAQKTAKQLSEAITEYIEGDTEHAAFTYTLSEAGLPKYSAEICTDGRYWVEDINGFSFMDASWNGKSVEDASNPFLIPSAKGEAEKADNARSGLNDPPKSTTKRKQSDS